MREFRLDSHTYDGRYLSLSCTQEPNPGENTSIVHWTLTVAGGNANYYTTGPTTVTIDGQEVYFAPTAYWNTYQFPAAKGSVSGQVEISHRIDGTKSVECTLETSIYTGTLKTAKATWELEGIARASTVGATDCYIGGVSMVAVDRKNSAYTHTIAFRGGTVTGYLQSDGTLSPEPVRLDSTTLSFPVSTALYQEIPESKALSCYLTVTTYLEDVPIGESQSCIFTAYTREEDCCPLVDGQVYDSNEATLSLTGDSAVLVRFFSRAVCQMTALGRNGAYIVKKQVGNVEVDAQQVELEAVETGTFCLQATDSRGYKATKTVEKTLIPYGKLTAKVTTRRQAPTSDRVELTVSGNCWNGHFGMQENTLTGLCQVGQEEIPLTFTRQGDTYTATVTLEGLEYDRTRYLQVTVEDALMALHLPVTVNPGVPVFDWGQKDFVFHVPVILSDGSAAISQKELLRLLEEWKNGGTV